MPEVVAFEGNAHTTTGVTWGAAAIRDGATLINALTRQVVSEAKFRAYLGAGTLVAVQPAIAIETGPAGQALVGVGIQRNAIPKTARSILKNAAVGFVSGMGWDYFVFSGVAALTASAREAVSAFVADSLNNAGGAVNPLDFGRNSLRAGLTLDIGSPELNAIWAYQNQDKPLAKDVARTNVQVGAGDIATFEQWYALLTTNPSRRFGLHWDGGAASKGIFPLPVTNVIGQSLDNIFNHAATAISLRYPTFNLKRPPQMVSWVGGSVQWNMELTEEGTLADRIGQLLVWDKVRKALVDGEGRDESLALRRAYETLVSPDADINLTVDYADEKESATRGAADDNPLRWAKQLSYSEAQITNKGGYMAYVRLTRSNQALDPRTWFREVLFGDLTWIEERNNGRVRERATVPIEVTLGGVFLGEMSFELTHDVGRNSHAEPPTWLHWNTMMQSALRSGFYAHHWVWIERIGQKLTLAIDAVPPHWLR